MAVANVEILQRKPLQLIALRCLWCWWIYPLRRLCQPLSQFPSLDIFTIRKPLGSPSYPLSSESHFTSLASLLTDIGYWARLLIFFCYQCEMQPSVCEVHITSHLLYWHQEEPQTCPLHRRLTWLIRGAKLYPISQQFIWCHWGSVHQIKNK